LDLSSYLSYPKGRYPSHHSLSIIMKRFRDIYNPFEVQAGIHWERCSEGRGGGVDSVHARGGRNEENEKCDAG
jgi:hypothetical protein